MTKGTYTAIGIAILALVIAGVAIVQSPGQLFSGAGHWTKESFNAGLFVGANRQINFTRDGTIAIGTSGTSQSLFIETTCNLSQSVPGSHAASSSKEYFCAVSGVQSDDTVSVILPPGAGAYSSGAASHFGGFVVGSAYATTSNRVAVTLLNNTGAATTSAPQATTSAKVLIYR